MKKVFFSIVCLLLFIPSLCFAGYLFYMDIDSDGKKNRSVLWVEGQDKRIDVYMDGELHTSMISTPKRKTPLFVMHDSETFMTKLPGLSDIPETIPEMKWEPTKRPIKPAQKAVDAMDNVEKTENMIEYFKNDPRNAARDTMTDLAYEVESRQQEAMMKKQMAKVREMQKKMNVQMQQQYKMMKTRTRKNVARKNKISLNDFKLKPTGKSKKIGKYKAKLVQVYYKDALFQDCWVDKGLTKEASASINALHTDPNLTSTELGIFYKTIKKLNEKIYVHGFPVLTITYYRNQTKLLYGHAFEAGVPQKVTMTLIRDEKKKISAKEFGVPKGYEEFKSVEM